MPTHFTQSEEKIFDEEFLSELHYVWPEIGEDFPDRIKQFILSHDARRDDEIKKALLEIAAAGEYEDMRRVVERFFTSK